MGKTYLFATDPSTGQATEIKADPAHLERQRRDLRAQGYTTTVLDEDERIRYGLLTQRLSARS